MFVHSVYFWLKADITEAQRDLFWERVRALKGIESISHCYIGQPAATDRPVVDRSYSCALIVVFDNEEGHEIYQKHPVHDRFRECSELWSKILIYDAVE
jgi:Stress responsive A/B Barrel Domain